MYCKGTKLPLNGLSFFCNHRTVLMYTCIYIPKSVLTEIQMANCTLSALMTCNVCHKLFSLALEVDVEVCEK